jgi:hypothetical protein
MCFSLIHYFISYKRPRFSELFLLQVLPCPSSMSLQSPQCEENGYCVKYQVRAWHAIPQFEPNTVGNSWSTLSIEPQMRIVFVHDCCASGSELGLFRMTGRYLQYIGFKPSSPDLQNIQQNEQQKFYWRTTAFKTSPGLPTSTITALYEPDNIPSW